MHLLAPLLAAAFLVPADADLAQLARDARSKKYDVRLDAYHALLDLGPEGIRVLEPILRDAEEKARKEFLSHASGSKAKGFRRKLKGMIEERRKEALKIIRDKTKYPDDAHGVVGQPLVDGAVSKLRDVWLRPGRLFLDENEEVKATLYYVREAAQYLKRAGFQPNWYDEDLSAAYRELDEQFDGLEITFSSRDRKEIEEIYEFNATGPGSATDEERRFARNLNDYRLMLGLDAHELDDRLVVAARKHSQEMMDMDYFAHESPVAENRTPGLRAQKEGYGGGVLENCSISADAQGAFDGWYNSSGHHRGLIANASQLGAGHSVTSAGRPGRQWTMLAGSSNSLRGKKPKGNPRLVFQERKRRLQPQDAETRFALARWCFKNDMPDEARELLREVVEIDREHKKAHLLLGHVRSNGVWVTAEEKLLADVEEKGPEEVLALVGERLGAEEPSVRLAAVRVIENFGDRAGLPLLVRALRDDASEVRDAACGALARTGDAAAAGPLKGALSDRSFYVAHSAAAALWRLGSGDGVATLFKGLRSGDLNPRLDAHRKARSVFGKDFGYAWDLPEVERAKVVDEWEAYVETLTPGG
ncbi:MAG: HEAT repeat domain-containing protein [Planctomycetota bacterium JB042]